MDKAQERKGMLSGLKVLDLTALLPGPFATVLLGDLGADVVKVESPAGDYARMMPVEMFRVANRNKRSIVVDLKKPAGVELVKRLAAWADVAVEGFRPGVVDRLGVGPSQLRAVNDSLIYCSISGYGQSGPWRDAPGHDFNYLAASGALSFLGHWGDRKPHRSGLPVADLAGSSFAVMSILAALHRRHATGQGATLDLSLTDAAMCFMSVRRGLDVDEPGRWHLYPTNDTFETADGRMIAFGIVEEHFWTAFVEAVGNREPRLQSPRFSSEASRREHGDELSALLSSLIRQRTADQWLKAFAGTNVPSQLVHTPREAADSEQTRARGVVMRIGKERHLPFPVLADGAPAGRLAALAPEAGQHTDSVLEELGYSPRERDSLKASGVCQVRRASDAPA